MQPLIFGFLAIIFQFQPHYLKLGCFFVLGALRCRTLFIEKLLDFLLQVLDLSRSALHVNAYLATGFIYKVDGFVRQITFSYIAFAVFNRRFDGGVGDSHFMMRLIPGTQPFKHLNGRFDARLAHENGL